MLFAASGDRVLLLEPPEDDPVSFVHFIAITSLACPFKCQYEVSWFMYVYAGGSTAADEETLSHK